MNRNRRLTLLAIALLVIPGLPCPVRAAEGEPTKILLVHTPLDHPWASHMYEQECKLLAHCLEQTKDVKAVVVRDWPDEKQLDGARSIVFYSRPAGDIVFHPEHRDQFQRLMKAGVGFAAIHWATGAEKELGEQYVDLLGGWFNFAHAGLKVDQQMLTQVDSNHPISRGWKPYSLRDEIYLNLKFSELAKPVLTVKVDDKVQVVAWVLERPNSQGGRSFGTTLGHFHENFAIPDFRRAIVNGILWSAHVEVPQKGAPVEASEEILKLPPQK
jgi:type 1 glutamine amidotransferase